MITRGHGKLCFVVINTITILIVSLLYRILDTRNKRYVEKNYFNSFQNYFPLKTNPAMLEFIVPLSETYYFACKSQHLTLIINSKDCHKYLLKPAPSQSSFLLMSNPTHHQHTVSIRDLGTLLYIRKL